MPRHRKISDSDPSNSQEDEEDYQNDHEPSHPNRRKSNRRASVRKDYNQSEQSAEQAEQSSEEDDYVFYRGGIVAKILCERKREGTNETERLCKFQSKSYLHLEWLTDGDATRRDIQIPPFLKTNQKRIKQQLKEVRDKFGPDNYFNPAFLRVDRVLTAAVLFPIMHHKKGSEMNGKWSEPMMLVCSKIINFEQDHMPFGIIQKDTFQADDIKRLGITDPIKLENVINRVYLDFYAEASKFWADVGTTIRNLFRVYNGSPHEYHTLVIRECAIFLYWQWYTLCRQRLLAILPPAQRNRFNVNMPRLLFACALSPNINFEKYVRNNFFLLDDDEPTPNETQLLKYNPGVFSYAWLGDQTLNDYTFTRLREQDFDKLNLNEKVDSLFLVKWCDLDYDEVTWEKESDLNCPQKIQNFKQYTKIPPSKERAKLVENKQHHKAILKNNKPDNKEKLSPEVIQKYRRKLFLLSRSDKSIKQFGEDDVPIYKGYKLLKNFQLEALNWLIKGWCERRNLILADQMGLGKTIQTIAFLNHLFLYEGVTGPFFVIAPVSTLKQWRSEIESWSDLNCVLYKGSSQSRELVEEYEFYHKFVTKQGIFLDFQKLPRFQVLLTNYEILVSDFHIFKKIPFQHIVVDEAQRLKNSSCKLAVMIRQLLCPRILLLTGTPIQNNCTELWGLLNIIEPNVFHSREDFKQQYGQLTSAEDLSKLKQLLKPYMMRRVKSDVEKSIPKLSEMLVDLDLTKIQKAFYRAVLQKNKNNLINSLSSVEMSKMSMRLREICNHPFMLSEEVEQEILLSCKSPEERAAKFISSSSKMIFVHKFLTKCKTDGSKTLIFTQFLQMVDLLAEYCSNNGVLYETLTGNVNYEERQNRIDRFNKNPEVLVFIISTKAGGVGINLTSATNIIVYDSDWNPQNDIQAIARAHRIGQKNNVSVYRLITVQTYEEIIYKSAVKKLGLGMAILDGDSFSNSTVRSKNSQKSKEELEKLLKDGVLGFLKTENEGNQEEGVNIENFSIDEIIAKNSQKIDFQSKDCSFSKTKFEHEGDKDKLEINDPNFWEVALKDIQSPIQKMVKIAKVPAEYKRLCEDIKEQTRLMIEANEIVYTFVKSKVTMTNFNAQDEKELKSFLEKISYERQFHKQYKKMVNEWLEEIQKPSRRFTKIDNEKIYEIASTKNPSALRLTRKARDEPLKRSNSKDEIEISSKSSNEMVDESEEKQSKSPSQNPYNIDGIAEASAEDSKSESPNQEKKVRSRGKSKKQKDRQEIRSQVEDNLLSFLSAFCAFCERRKCSMICKADCHKSYHHQCYELYKMNGSKDSNYDFEEDQWTDQQFIQKLSEDFKCFECSIGISSCFLCNEKGDYVPSQWLTKGAPKRPDKGTRNYDDKNFIDELLQRAEPIDKKNLHQCRMNCCMKFYHLKCLKKVKESLPFEIYLNREKNTYPLKCPSHFCSVCRNPVPVGKLSCLRCPASLHQKCKAVKKDHILEMSNQHFICLSHLSQAQRQAIKCEQSESKMFKHERMAQKRLKKALEAEKQSQMIEALAVSIQTSVISPDAPHAQNSQQKTPQPVTIVKKPESISKSLLSRHGPQRPHKKAEQVEIFANVLDVGVTSPNKSKDGVEEQEGGAMMGE